MSAQPASNSMNPGMQVTTFENPMGIDGFEFVEFAVPPGHAEAMHRYLCSMGFSATRRHKARAITLYRLIRGQKPAICEEIESAEVRGRAAFANVWHRSCGARLCPRPCAEVNSP